MTQTNKNGQKRKSTRRTTTARATERALIESVAASQSPEDAEKRRNQIKALLAMGKERGYVTYAEINDHLPDDITDADQIEAIVTTFNNLGIKVFEEAPSPEELLISDTAPAIAHDDDLDEQAEQALSTVDSEFGRTTDPVRMYMREMGHSELLTREGEIEIAKRIEDGQRSMVQAIAACPPTIAFMLETVEKIENDKLRVDEVVDGLIDNLDDIVPPTTDEEDDAESLDDDIDEALDESDDDATDDSDDTFDDVSDEDEEEEEDDEEELEEEDEADDDVDPVLRSRVEEAFRASGLADDNDDDNNASNNEEDDVAVLDDDQMAKLDDKLAEIFQQHTSSKRKEREALQRDTALFHNKILDLLDMYAKEQSGNALVLRLIAPLLALARGSGDVSQQVATRASQILRQRLCKSKELPRGEIDVDELVRELSATHELARTSHDATMADLAAAVSHLYTKVLVRHLQIDGPVTVFKHTLQDFLERKSSPVRPAFIIEAIRRYPELGWGLRHALLDGCHMSKAARAFRQVQAYTMLQAVLQQQQHPDTRQASVQDVLSFIAQVRHVVGETVMAAASSAENDDGATSLNAQRLKDVLRFALQGVRMTVRISDGQATSVQACWPPDELEAILQALQSSERFKSSSSLHSIMKEMLSLIRRSDPSPSSSGLPTKQKRRASENGGENSENFKRRASSGPTKIRSTDTST